MTSVAIRSPLPEASQKALVYHFCRLRWPMIPLPYESFLRHLQRAHDLYEAKRAKEGEHVNWLAFLASLHAGDWYLVCGCLERLPRAWEALFALRVNRADCLLLDALRARAVRLYPRNQERQETAVADFWGYLLAGEKEGSLPILARYDGQRPLVPWLIRVFQNKHISELRQAKGLQVLPEDELGGVELPLPVNSESRWHQEFRQAAREWLGTLADNALLILGLRLRYRLSQRQVATLLGVHEGNISRQTTRLRDHCLEEIGKHLVEAGWIGDDLSDFILKEMDSLVMDEPRLAVDHLAALLASRGKSLHSLPGADDADTGTSVGS